MDSNLELRQTEPGGRYLGIDVRPHGFGFVVLEDSILLDCGNRACDHREYDACLRDRFSRILKIYTPAAVVVGLAGSRAERPSRIRIIKLIKSVAAKNQIPVVFITRSKLTRHFRRQYNASTKYEIAQAAANVVRELTWRLPNKRKPWQSEHPRMSIFAAAALALAHIFSQEDTGTPTKEATDKPGLTRA
jgi:hypothetical protein